LEAPLKTVGVPPFSHTYAACPKCEEEKLLQIANEEKDRLAVFEKWRQDGITTRIYAGIPPRFKSAALTDFDLTDHITGWITKPKDFLLITGPCGVGKSRLACAMTMALRKKEIETTLIFSSELFLALRRSFNHSIVTLTEWDITSKLTRAPVLICDDIGVQKHSEYVIEAWYNIVDSRYRNCRPTAFTSNLNLKEISTLMSDRIASRLMSGTVVNLVGRDRRLKG
jgi:DNA replication protein DnaC